MNLGVGGTNLKNFRGGKKSTKGITFFAGKKDAMTGELKRTIKTQLKLERGSQRGDYPWYGNG